MDSLRLENATQARQIVNERGLTAVKLGVFDLDGVLRGKYVSA